MEVESVRDVSGKTDGGEVDTALASVEEVVRRVARQEVWKKKTGREPRKAAQPG